MESNCCTFFCHLSQAVLITISEFSISNSKITPETTLPFSVAFWIWLISFQFCTFWHTSESCMWLPFVLHHTCLLCELLWDTQNHIAIHVAIPLTLFFMCCSLPRQGGPFSYCQDGGFENLLSVCHLEFLATGSCFFFSQLLKSAFLQRPGYISLYVQDSVPGLLQIPILHCHFLSGFPSFLLYQVYPYWLEVQNHDFSHVFLLKYRTCQRAI